MSVFKKLADARVMLQQSNLKKSGHNKYAGYDYFELHDFMPRVNEIFKEVGLCGFVTFSDSYARIEICDTNNKDSSKVEITCPLSSASLKGCHDVQNLGAVITYTRRYLWMLALEIVEHDGLDASTGVQEVFAGEPKQNTEKHDKIKPVNSKSAYATEKMSDDQVLLINDMLAEAGVSDASTFLGYFKVDKVADLPASKYEFIIKQLENKINEKDKS